MRLNWKAVIVLLGALAGAAPACAADVATLSPRTIGVGKWPEGLAFAAGRLFVAESGQKSLAAVDPKSGGVLDRAKVGRLPVGVSVGADDVVNTLVETDKLVWRQTANGAPRAALKGLAGCPTGLDARGAYVWVLTEPKCSSESGRVIRIDPANGARASSSLLGDSPEAILALPGHTWVTHARAPALSVIDEESLAVSTFDAADAALRAISASGGKLFAGGNLRSRSDQGVVVMLDAADSHEIRRQLVDQPVDLIVSDNKHVVAIGDRGRMWVFSATNLDYLRTINLSTGSFEPRGAAIEGDSLYVTDSRQNSATGVVFILDAWRPGTAVAARKLQPTTAADMTTECPYHVLNVAASAVLWMYQQPDANSPKVVGIPATGNGLKVQQCTSDWCSVQFGAEKGWVAKANIGAVCD